MAAKMPPNMHRKPGSGNAKPVRPAIPLPHVKRQAAAAAAATTRAPKALENTATEKASATPEAQSTAQTVAEGTGKVTQHGVKPTSATAPVVNGRSHARGKANSQHDAKATTPTASSEPDETKPEGPAQHDGLNTRGRGGTPPVSRPSSMTLRQQMAPPFQPSGLLPHLASAPETMNGLHAQQPPPLPPPPHMVNGHSHTHSSHPSFGSTHFSAFHGSTGSSPAPPLSGGGIASAPGMPVPDARQSYMAHTPAPVGGFPPSIPPGLENMMGVDMYGHPGMAYAHPMDPFQQQQQHQYGNNFPLSTSHSFHDSQSSVRPEDGGPYRQYATPRSDVPRLGEDARHVPAGSMGPPSQQGPPSMGPPPNGGGGDDASGLVEHIQQQFGTPELADCTLELRHPDPRVPPIRIPGHRIVLSRSPVLGELMRKQALSQQQPQQPTLSLQAQDDWIRADTFYMACQRLYGLPLLAVPPRMDMDMDNSTTTAAGNALDRFNFALSYAGAGHLLGWGPVVRRGCEIAAELVSLETAETAMAFALSRHEDRGSYENLRYGDGSRALLGAVLGFVASKLSPSFKLDTSVSTAQQGGVAGYSRLPQASRSLNQPPPHIQFGDLSLTNGQQQPPSAADAPQASQQHATTALPTILSRILINLPFSYLKMLLESSMHGWAGAETRLSVVLDVVREREARRERAIDAVNAGRIPEFHSIQAALSNTEPAAAHSSPWALLAWQEEVTRPSSADGPCLGRRWVPLRGHEQVRHRMNGNAAGAAYP
ncbi:hypothetical protein GMORB2_7049 [Geosmithia morbida]|uniref:Uncharacterized protein n=1 Tax=Geosmithia morbida TaxID=1094350 RepID=A0A9P4YUE9_9HYPO|nr:uncharacterized protein GMORB2_7049 [Geosmithia morbida]KAF4122742.1 hypothetical protein GMORB2_7049 [Geosmithia morbida]